MAPVSRTFPQKLAKVTHVAGKRTFKTKWFVKEAMRRAISDRDLCAALATKELMEICHDDQEKKPRHD
jgi:hypothetical protein